MFEECRARAVCGHALRLLVAAGALAAPGPVVSQVVLDLSGEDRPISLDLEELYTVGSVDGAEWELFQTLDAAAFGPDGTLYLLDASSHRIVAVRDGALAHAVGRVGDGPGEYREPEAVAAFPDGTVAVWDGGKRAFVLFGADGSPREQVRPAYGAGVPAGPMAALGDGSVLALPSHLVSGSRGAIYLTGDGYRSASEGLPLLRVPVEDGGRVGVVARVPTLQGGATDPATRAFEPTPSWGALAGRRVALATTDRYEVRIVEADGTPVRVLRRPLEPRPTTAADEEAFRRFVRDRYQRAVRRAAETGLVPVPPGDEVNAHPVIPPIRRITADGAGTIWVQRPRADDPMRPGPVDVLAADGRYLGTVSDPPHGLPAAFGPRGLVVFLTTGAFDVPVARVYRLPEALR